MVAFCHDRRITMFHKSVFAKVSILVLLIGVLLLCSSSGAAQTRKIHPVILIHGLNARFDDWENNPNGIYDVLEGDGYDMGLVSGFAYPPGENNEIRDGDVYAIAARLNQEAENLSQQSQIAGGPERVDIVAHSLGGLITRQYLSQNFSNHKIGKFIDIGTPHSGVDTIGIYNGGVDILSLHITESLGGPLTVIAQDLVSRATHEIIGQAWDYYNIDEYIPDPTSPAAQQLDPNGSFMQALNQPGLSPLDVEYAMIYGDITLQFQFDFFGYQVLSHELLSFGDIVVSRGNAATIPHLGTRLGPNPSNYTTHQFRRSTTLLVEQDISFPVFFFPNLALTVEEMGDVWHSGLLSNPEVNALVLQILNDGFQPGPDPITPFPDFGGDASTVLVFDTSGSMDGFDRTGITKLEAAKHAGGNILDILEAEASSSTSLSGQIGLVRFGRSASIPYQMTTNINEVRSVLQRFNAQGGTCMAAGIYNGIEMLRSSNTNSRKVMVLLSDGLPNILLSGENRQDHDPVVKQELLDLASEAGNNGICIYTVGFGQSVSGGGAIDEDLLQQISRTSGCGEYYGAQDATQLANVYVSLRHSSTGNILLQQTGNISQGEEVQIASIEVPQYQSQILFTLNWPGSQLEPVLIDPSSQIVDTSYPGASFASYSSLASIIIQDPKAGTWQVSARGVDVPKGRTTYNAILSSRPSPITPIPTYIPATPTPEPVVITSPGFPVVILALVLGGGAIAIYVLARSTSRLHIPFRSASNMKGKAYLIGKSSNLIGKTFEIRDGWTIGRGRACQIKLSDPSISRQHARFRFSQSQWYIQDLQSSTSTYVNNVKISAAVLNHGDVVRIGFSQLTFIVG